MSETNHSPEPWRVVDETYVCFGPPDAAGRDTVAASAFQEEDARRIVAAVNACAGIPTEALESGALGKALDGLAFVLSLLDDERPMPAFEAEDVVAVMALLPRVEQAREALRALGRLPHG